MSIDRQRIVYVNGRYLRHDKATVSIFDRGFLFGDGIYEVTAVIGGKILEWEGHWARLVRSLHEIGMTPQVSEAELLKIHRTLIRRNRLDQGRIYLEVTRGAYERDFVFPPQETAQTLVVFTQAAEIVDAKDAREGIAMVSVPDIRWARRDIKSVALLAQVLAKQQAKEKGGKEALMHENGIVTEGGASTMWIVTKDGTIVTRPNSQSILPGVTRASLQAFCEERQMRFEERTFTIDEVRNAKEAFITAASAFVTPVVKLDGVAVGDGNVGEAAKALRRLYLEEALKSAV
jgi:D-alanine transaminase